MYNRILVPLDGSELAEQVLPHVTEVAQRTHAQIILLRVPDMPVNDYGMEAPWFSVTAREQSKVETAKYLDLISSSLRKLDLDVRTEIGEPGSVYATILDKAKELNVDLIAMSTHGRSGLARLVMGSVADDVVRHSAFPVLLVRPHPVSGSKHLHKQMETAAPSAN